MPISLSQVISVVLALAVVYYILGLIVSALTKWLLETLETRGKTLEKFLKNNLLGAAEGAKNFTLEKLRKTPQINALRPVRYKFFGLGILTGQTRLSAHVEHISPRTLVDALFDLEETAKDQKEKVKKVIEKLPAEFTGLDGKPIPFETRATLIAMADSGFYTFDQWREKLETWFGNVMDQSALQFKAKARQFVLLFSLLAAFGLGVDTIDIAQRVWRDAGYAKQFDNQATLILESGDEKNKQESLDNLYGSLDTLRVINIPFWVQPHQPKAGQGTGEAASSETRPAEPQTKVNWLLMRVLGLLITGIAVAQGSSFWYDIIRQIKGEPKKSTATVAPTETGAPPAGSETALDFLRTMSAPASPRARPKARPDK